MNPENIVNLNLHPIQDGHYTKSCKDQFDNTGALVMENFLSADTVGFLQNEAREVRPLAFFCHQNHNVYLLDS
ncbi:MAG: 2OG-Fe(II) oxygenase, partial [SAR324 cluster bacterium]|nr:2OG-Fe(II) oxygenase [SAR324 cluster bacterium]